jgi:hypothetical protein
MEMEPWIGFVITGVVYYFAHKLGWGNFSFSVGGDDSFDDDGFSIDLDFDGDDD